MGEESWWINDHRWSGVRELAPEMTHRLRHNHKQALDEDLSLPLLSFPSFSYRKCVVQIFSQVEVERRDRKHSLYDYASCCPSDRALNGSTGAPHWNSGHSCSLNGVGGRHSWDFRTATVTAEISLNSELHLTNVWQNHLLRVKLAFLCTVIICSSIGYS